MQTLADIKALLAQRNLAPRKALGQNFLIDHNLILKLVDAAGVAAGDLVLEVGPGTGTLTDELVRRGCDVVACELDRGLADLLRERLPARITLVEGDCLAGKHALSEPLRHALGGRTFTLVANLPYGAASPLMLTLAIDHPGCRAMHVTIQKEVADRLRAAPGGKDYGVLSVVMQALCHIRHVATLPPACFWPRPKVTSRMLSITRRPDPLTHNPRGLAALCHHLFSKRRKQLGSILGRDFPWPEGTNPEMRPEDVGVAQIVAMARARPAGDRHPRPPLP